MHANHQIYERVLRLLENFFVEEEDSMLDVGLNSQSTTNTSAGQFHF